MGKRRVDRRSGARVDENVEDYRIRVQGATVVFGGLRDVAASQRLSALCPFEPRILSPSESAIHICNPH